MAECFITRRGGSGGGSNRPPKYTYTGTSELVDDGEGNWRILLKTSGTLTFSAPNSAKNGIDVFLVGGGAGGALRGAGNNGAGGGGGGYTHTEKNITVLKDKAYDVIVGAGGARAPIMVEVGSRGGTTQAFGFTAEGGGATKDSQSWAGGDGGSGGGGAGGTGNGGDGGVDGANGIRGDNSSGGIGQGTTTREFGEPNGTIYGCGGGGGAGRNISAYAKGYYGAGDGGSTSHTATSAVANTGGGGGGANAGGTVCGDGGSGIVIIRNARG